MFMYFDPIRTPVVVVDIVPATAPPQTLPDRWRSPHLRTKMFSNTTARVSCSNPAIHNRDPVQSMVRILGRQLEPTSSISSLGHTPGRDNQQLRNRYEDLLATADDYTAPLHTHTSDVRSAPFMIDRYSPILYFLI